MKEERRKRRISDNSALVGKGRRREKKSKGGKGMERGCERMKYGRKE